MILSVDNINVHYGAIQALRGVSFNLNEGEIVTLIGANGAGKSTSLNTISGLLHPSTGTIHYKGEDISNVSPQDIVQRGMIQVPEGRKIFSTMSVWENLEMGAYANSNQKEIDTLIEQSFERFPRLKERRNQQGGTLSGGEQQMLAIARGLMAKPRVLLLDEPSMGLSPIMVEQIFDTIREINQGGTSILLVEQNALMALSIADRGYVLDTGRVVLEGPANDLLHNPVTVEIGIRAPVDTVSQAIYQIEQDHKLDTLLSLLSKTDKGQTLVFTRTKHRAQKIALQLSKTGLAAKALQGNLSQNRRQEVMDGFRSGQVQVMVATDIAARGIDVSRITHVINFDMPNTVDAYTHRIGRTGRMAKLGTALTFVTQEDLPMLRTIEHVLGHSIERRRVEPSSRVIQMGPSQP